MKMRFATAAVVLALLSVTASAQEHQMLQGRPARWAEPNKSSNTPPPFGIEEWMDVGRGYLRWWSPLVGSDILLDNDEAFSPPSGIGGNTSATGGWTTPAALGATTYAFNYDHNTVDEYRLTRSVAQTLNTTDPTAGATDAYQWTFTNLNPGAAYELFVNLPIGPTSSVFPAAQNDFPQRYNVYEVTGIATPHIDVIDVLVNNGLAQLGENGVPTSRTFVPTGNSLTITLHNTAPRGDNGQLLDPQATPGAEWVYADSASIVESFESIGGGSYRAGPVIRRLQNSPPAGASPLNNIRAWRVAAPRNEDVSIASLSRSVPMSFLESFFYDGNIAAVAEPSRLNKVWSWPVKKPIDTSPAELTRFEAESDIWVNGPIPGNERHTFRQVQDNTAAGSFLSGVGFAASIDPAHSVFLGPNYYLSPVVPGGVSAGAAQFRANLPTGTYEVEVWMPTLDAGTLASVVTYGIFQGGIQVDTLTLNQAASSGWVRLPGQPSGGYGHGPGSGALEVVVYNNSINPGDAGLSIFADAVRFSKPADLSINSTPVFSEAVIDDGVTTELRDIVIVASEDGKIYCIDGHGNFNNGEPPTVYWTYPSDNPATDPNGAPSQDGGVAENPTGFDTSSALLIGDRLYIAAKNGRVYCLDVTGRGDGTTSRNWTYPDDYRPSAPDSPRAGAYLPFVGSIAYDADNNNIIIPTIEGRLVAVDAAGSAASRTTTVDWIYPSGFNSPLGPMLSTPVAFEGDVIFNAPSTSASLVDEVFSVDGATGSLNWRSSVGPQNAGVFAPFVNAGPTVVEGSQVAPPGPAANRDSIIVCDSAGRLASLNPANGRQRWSSVEVPTGAAGAPTFIMMEVYDNPSGNPRPEDPLVIIPTNGGSLIGCKIAGLTNSGGERRVFQYDLVGNRATPPAVGGWRPGDPYAWLYTADDAGTFYAFNGDSSAFITPGTPPGRRIGTIDDPGPAGISNVFDSNKIILISPEAYETLQTDFRNGSLDRPQILQAAAQEEIDRRNFEFGETLYILAYDLPDLSGGVSGVGDYRAEVLVTVGTRQIRRQVPVNPIPGMQPGPNSQFVLTANPLLPTGSRSLMPGVAEVSLVARPIGNTGVDSTPVHLSPPAGNGEVLIANPLALYFDKVGIDPNSNAFNSIGDTTDALYPLNLINGSGGYDTQPGAVAGPAKETATGNPMPGGYFGPNPTRAGDDVFHAGTAALNVQVRDRSLMFLVLGPQRGMQNVRLSSDDMEWQVRSIPSGNILADRNTWKPLLMNTGANYPSFEELPTIAPNRSLDYSNIGRSRLSASKSAFGRVENPLFSGVGLNPPLALDADLNTYRTKAGYENQLTRQLTSTPFDLSLDIPRFQPASGPMDSIASRRPGYRGHPVIYIDGGGSGFQATSDTYRDFAAGVRIAPDERLSLGTPTIDLGSMPSGGGMNGGTPTGFPNVRGPRLSWDPTSIFRPWRSEYDNMFEDFSVFNDGNVNMLNVRVAKAYDRLSGGLGNQRIFRPLELFSPSLHELSWIDGPLHMFSSLDPLYSNTGRAGQDAEARNILQKARPGDAVSTRLSTNPIRRANVNLGVTGGTLLNAVTYDPGDPRIGVSTPIGAASGEYVRRIFVFEDTLGSNGANPETPSLGPRQTTGLLNPDDFEAFSDPPMNLKFMVRETRLTNRPTLKSAPFASVLVNGTENHYWKNRQPTGLRNALGTLLVASSSNQLDAANNPSFGPRPRLEVDDATDDNWRIYLRGVLGSLPGASAGSSPTRDLNGFSTSTPTRWAENLNIIPSVGSPLSLFSLPGYTGVGGSADFYAPSFPNGSPYNPLDDPAGGPAPAGTRFLAFLGSADALDGQGTRRQATQVMAAEIDITTGAIGGYETLPFDPFSRKSRPSIVQQGSDFSVFYTSYSSAAGQVKWSSHDGTGWSTPRSLPLTRAFGSLEVGFAARRRGRAYSESMIARLVTDGTGIPVPVVGDSPNSEFNAMRPFGPRLDELHLDTSSGSFWAPGMMWRMGVTDTDFISPTSIQIIDSGSGLNLLDPATTEVSPETGKITGSTPFGGSVTLDPTTGSVRFEGALIPRSRRLFIRYTPYCLSVLSGGTMNARSVNLAFDDRMLGVFVHPTDPQRTLIGDMSYWANEIGAQVQPEEPVRWDRTIVAASRTSGDGGQAVRPSMRTLRFGIQLPTPIALDANGIAQISISWTGGIGGPDQVPAGSRYYQIDPANGRIYLMAGAEDRLAGVTYTPADTTGQPSGAPISRIEQIVLVPETSEQTIPIEQAGNEIDLRIMLDSMKAQPDGSSPVDRRPGLLWLFWTSSRSGDQDVYFQTLAPRFSIIPPG